MILNLSGLLACGLIVAKPLEGVCFAGLPFTKDSNRVDLVVHTGQFSASITGSVSVKT